MDCLSKIIQYRNLLDEVKISGDEHLKVILQDAQAYLEKANEIRSKISSDSNLPSDYRENYLREISSYIEKVEQGKSNGQAGRNDFTYLLTLLATAFLSYQVGYNKKSEETNEKQVFISEALAALKEELKKYL
jgi:hypothetical protein